MITSHKRLDTLRIVGPTSWGQVPWAEQPGRLLQLFRSRAVATRNELQQVTGLARSTVAYKIDALLAARLPGRGRQHGRRPGPTVHPASGQRPPTTVLAADLGPTHGRLAVSTAAGDVLAETVIESSIDKGPETVLHVIARVRRAAGSGRAATASLRGIGMGVPGPVDWATGRIARSISMPGWDNYPVRQHLVGHYAVPAVVDNDANMLGLGEQRRVYPDAHLVLFVKVGTGIGASVILDGNLLRGSASAEGDIGHAKVRGITETCSTCGATGCLAAIASGRAMARDLRRLGREADTTHDVVNLVRAGDAEAVRDRHRRRAGAGRGPVHRRQPAQPGRGRHRRRHRACPRAFPARRRETLLERSQPLASANLISPRPAR